MRVLTATPEAMSWLEERVGKLTPHARGIVAANQDGSIAGVVGYDFWTPASVQMHLALGTARAVLPLLRAAFVFPFLTAQRKLVLATIPGHRWRAVRLAKRLGFVETHRVADGWDDGSDLIHFQMKREACRWLPRKAA